MATGKALICKLGKHIEIPGADRIVQVDMFGETIITQKSNIEGTVGLLFDMETCLTHEYASKNNMYRHSELNENKNITGYLEDDRRIRPVRLKGVKCSALFMSIETLIPFRHTIGPEYKSGRDTKESNLENFGFTSIGQEADEVVGTKICEKYISKATKRAISNKEGKVRQNLVPTFKEHIDTDQWSRNTHKVQEGNLVIITEKLHGTSGRCGNLLVEKKNSWWKNLLLTWIRGREITHTLEYEFVVGSRRVVKSIGGNEAENKSHFYDEDLWTKISKEYFEGKLYKGETVYFEIVGYVSEGSLIMNEVHNTKLKNFLSKEEYNEFITKYGEITRFTYNQAGATSGVYVYRITMTNEDGDSLDLSWDQVKIRCEKLGVNHVPELDKDLVPVGFDNSIINDRVQFLTNQESNIFPNHIREGVCVRIENGSNTPIILKEKAYIFKVLEGIIKDTDVVDIEESN